jgi:arsenate reductase
MAEAFLRALHGDAFEALSAGTEATGIRAETVIVMEEIGISLAGQWSKTMDAVRTERVDWFITVCGDAREACPVLPGVAHAEHWSIDDPAAVQGAGRPEAFRRARDEIRRHVDAFVRANAPQ